MMDIVSAAEGKGGVTTTTRTFDDVGNAERLVDVFGADIKWCKHKKKFLAWNGKVWEEEGDTRMYAKVKQMLRRMMKEADDLPTEERAVVKSHIRASSSKRQIDAMVGLVKMEAAIHIHVNELDSQPTLLNFSNGTLDLETFELLPHTSTHYLTQILQYDYNPDAPCDRWLEFLDVVFNFDEELIHYVRKCVGYSLTGNTDEQVLFFFYGSGSNGKTTFVDTLRSILSGYAAATDTSTLMVKSNSSIRNDLARLQPCRYVVASESTTGRVDEVTVKNLTGGEAITARFLYREHFDYVPKFKIWLSSNHYPTISGTDWAIWRRIRLVPFTMIISPEDRDPGLKQKLLNEAEGILAWAVEGCRMWREEGLNPPAVVRKATENYRRVMDPLAHFVDERLVEGYGQEIECDDLYERYLGWLPKQDKRLRKAEFEKKLMDRSHGRVSKVRDAGTEKDWFRGVGLAVPINLNIVTKEDDECCEDA